MIEFTPLPPFGVQARSSQPHRPIQTLDPEEVADWVDQHKLVVLRGFSSVDETGLKAFAQRLGPMLRWEFGEVLNLKVADNPSNHLFRGGRVEMHWDGAYLTEVPPYSLFQCLHSSQEQSGGETLFTHTPRVVQKLPPDLLTTWQRTRIHYSTDKAAHYSGSVTVPLLGRHPKTLETTVRFIEPYNEDNADINPVQVVVDGLSQSEQEPFLRDVIARLYEPQVMYRHAWRTGDFLIYDNQALLHGRAVLRGNLQRHLQRIHILENHGDLHSRAPVFIGTRQIDVHV